MEQRDAEVPNSRAFLDLRYRLDRAAKGFCEGRKLRPGGVRRQRSEVPSAAMGCILGRITGHAIWNDL